MCAGLLRFNRVPSGPQEAEGKEDKGGDGDEGKEEQGHGGYWALAKIIFLHLGQSGKSTEDRESSMHREEVLTPHNVFTCSPHGFSTAWSRYATRPRISILSTAAPPIGYVFHLCAPTNVYPAFFRLAIAFVLSVMTPPRLWLYGFPIEIIAMPTWRLVIA